MVFMLPTLLERCQRHQLWSKHFGRHFLIHLHIACVHFNQTYHIYSLPGPR